MESDASAAVTTVKRAPGMCPHRGLCIFTLHNERGIDLTGSAVFLFALGLDFTQKSEVCGVRVGGHKFHIVASVLLQRLKCARKLLDWHGFYLDTFNVLLGLCLEWYIVIPNLLPMPNYYNIKTLPATSSVSGDSTQNRCCTVWLLIDY